MGIAVRQRDGRGATLRPVDGLVCRRETDPTVMAALQARSLESMEQRFAAGHEAWIAWVHNEPAAWGWVATRAAEIGELGFAFVLPAGERYLWNFVTRPEWRGRGIYPHLLDAIIAAETPGEVDRFWIAWAPENHASAAGVTRAGFTRVAEMSFDSGGRPALTPVGPQGVAAVRLLRLPMTEQLAACWRCSRAASAASAGAEPRPCSAGTCACDYQRPEKACRN